MIAVIAAQPAARRSKNGGGASDDEQLATVDDDEDPAIANALVARIFSLSSSRVLIRHRSESAMSLSSCTAPTASMKSLSLSTTIKSGIEVPSPSTVAVLRRRTASGMIWCSSWARTPTSSLGWSARPATELHSSFKVYLDTATATATATPKACQSAYIECIAQPLCNGGKH